MRRIVVLVTLVIVVGCGGASNVADSPGRSADRPTVRFGDDAIFVEIASERDELQRGLMFRKQLAADAGMLFVMGSPSTTGFWMKNTLIPLSIAYMRRLGTADRYEVVSLRDMEPCPPQETSCPLYPPDATYDVALEVNRGWFAEHGVEVGAQAVVEGL